MSVSVLYVCVCVCPLLPSKYGPLFIFEVKEPCNVRVTNVLQQKRKTRARKGNPRLVHHVTSTIANPSAAFAARLFGTAFPVPLAA